MIKVEDNGEELVELDKICPGLIIRLKKNRRAYLRKTVAEMVRRAKNFLPANYTFIIGDAWRSAEVQKGLHRRFYRQFKREQPEWSRKRIQKEIEEYVAPYEGGNVSGHMVGAAVDLSLSKNGRKVPLKSSKLSYQENSLSDQKDLPSYIKRNRKIMFEALEKAGLSNFPKEFWHWSYGDRWWAERNNKKVIIYGIKDDIS